MGEPSPEIWLARHGETTWSRDWLHTSVTDVPLTDRGMQQARELGHRLAGRSFVLVLSSPRLRARRTAELAGFPDAEVDDDLVEWHYGSYEGISTAEIRTTRVRLDRLGPSDPRRRDGRRRRCPRRPGDRARPGRRRRRPAVRPRAHAACPRGTLARPGSDGRPPVPARHRVDLRARLRARDAGDPHLERLSSGVARHEPHLAGERERAPSSP